MLAGNLFVFVAVLCYIYSMVSPIGFIDGDNRQYPSKEATSKAGGVILIGPLPIIVSSDFRWAVLLTIVAIIIVFSIYILIPVLF
jgi:uncharacterized protein (TIGR00304 family)